MSLSTLADAVFCTLTGTPGTSTLTLNAAVTGYFGPAALTDGGVYQYTIYDADTNGVPNGGREIGVGTYTASGTTLARNLIFQSTNSGSAVSFLAGARVFLSPCAETLEQTNCVANGRLTLTTLTPVTTSDVTAAATVYFTPWNGNRVKLWNGYCWQTFLFSELSLALGTLTSATNYDVFLWNSSGTLTLVLGPAWTSGTARGTGAGTTQLSLQDGVNVNTVSLAGGPAAKLGLYLGTIRTTTTTTTEDSVLNRFVWNQFNRVRRKLLVTDTTSSWTYGSATWRQVRGYAGNQVAVVTGLAGEMVDLWATEYTYPADGSGAGFTGIGVNWSSGAASNDLDIPGLYQSSAAAFASINAAMRHYPAVGLTTYTWLEMSSPGTTTFASGSTPGNGDGIAGMLGSCMS